MFEIENHGLNHKPCSIDGESIYGIHGTSSVEEAFDEIEANARKIEALTGHRPRFYRSATAFIDEVCVSMAARLGISVVSYQALSGDAVPFAPDSMSRCAAHNADISVAAFVAGVEPGLIGWCSQQNGEGCCIGRNA